MSLILNTLGKVIIRLQAKMKGVGKLNFIDMMIDQKYIHIAISY